MLPPRRRTNLGKSVRDAYLQSHYLWRQSHLNGYGGRNFAFAPSRNYSRTPYLYQNGYKAKDISSNHKLNGVSDHVYNRNKLNTTKPVYNYKRENRPTDYNYKRENRPTNNNLKRENRPTNYYDGSHLRSFYGGDVVDGLILEFHRIKGPYDDPLDTNPSVFAFPLKVIKEVMFSFCCCFYGTVLYCK